MHIMHSGSYIPDKCRYKKPPRELQPDFADSCSVALCVCALWREACGARCHCVNRTVLGCQLPASEIESRSLVP